ncbi:uncharacterized protein CDAR_550431 [Caerostris darwini]|uniref:Uncharacterized protein n=1 Tax=Caerostris darwini TaxID=1538125 RepID=A0AAV4X6X7_9ARAC|nr:uncharacterized protein CDAR_550431 [Caerostris darwini]
MLILSHKIVTTAVYQYHDVKNVPRTKELRNNGRNLVENNRLHLGNYRTANQRLLQGTTKLQVPYKVNNILSLRKSNINNRSFAKKLVDYRQHAPVQKLTRLNSYINNRRNTVPQPLQRNKKVSLTAVQSMNTKTVRKPNNKPINVAANKLIEKATFLRRNLQPPNYIKISPRTDNHQLNVTQNNKTKRYYAGNQKNGKQTHRQKPEPFLQKFAGKTLYTIEIFFILVPVASLLAAILGLTNYCYARKNSKSDHQGSNPSIKDHSESTIGSALLGSNSHGNPNPHFTKSETDIWRSLIANEFDGEGDQVGKRMKLERWMYQKCNCCPDEIEQKRKVDRYIQEMKALKDKRLADVNRDKESTEHNNPNRMLPSNGVPSNNSPYSSGTRRSGSIGDLPYKTDQNNSMRTFDSHNTFGKKENKDRNNRKSRSKKKRDKYLKDSVNKISSEPFQLPRTHAQI